MTKQIDQVIEEARELIHGITCYGRKSTGGKFGWRKVDFKKQFIQIVENTQKLQQQNQIMQNMLNLALDHLDGRGEDMSEDDCNLRDDIEEAIKKVSEV